MKRTIIIPTLIATGMLAAACSASEPDSSDVSAPSAPANGAPTTRSDPDRGDDDAGSVPQRDDDPNRSARMALQRFDECGAFLDYVHTEGAERVGAYGFGDVGWNGPRLPVDGSGDLVTATDAMAETDSATSGESTGAATAPASQMATEESGDDSGGSSADVSTTNVQVDGVDEPDIVKTDGDRILAVTNNELHLVDVDGATLRDSIPLADGPERDAYLYGLEILFSGDRAFVIAQADNGVYYGDDVIAPDSSVVPIGEPLPSEPLPSDPLPSGSGPIVPGPSTTLIEVDLSDPDALAIENTLTFDGRYISARAIGDTARIAVTSPPRDLGFLYPSSRGAEQAATEANRELIRDSTIEDWVPGYTLTTSDGTSDAGDLVECDSIQAPNEFAGFDMLSIVTVPLDESLAAPGETTSVMATGDTVYASSDRLYVSTNEWMPPTFDEQQQGEWEDDYRTGIHRFALPAGEVAVYEASGTVDGHLLNQFSMHDDGDTFFVATTTGTPWSGEGSESQIVSMQANGDRLEAIGEVGGLGKGEQIFSVRYVDDVAYVVTFRQTDPFYVVDLSTPTDMVMSGELKIPGVSNYLHPISDTLVLGVGQDATDDGQQTGSKVSLFDVSDPAAPRELDVWSLPGASSDVEFDHRAFLWWEATSTAVLPLISYSEQFAGAVVLSVTEDGITEQGRITHHDEANEELGATDCRVLDESQLTEDDGELFWYAQEGQINLCTNDQQGGAVGHYCDPILVDDIGNYISVDAVTVDIDLDGIDRVEMCWIDGGFAGSDEAIQRSMVISDDLWTLSNGRLQSNDLGSLDRTAAVDLT